MYYTQSNTQNVTDVNIFKLLEGFLWRSRGWDFTFQCREWGFDPWLESWDPISLTTKKPKHKNRRNIVTNSLNTLKMVHIEKQNLKKKNTWRNCGFWSESQKKNFCSLRITSLVLVEKMTHDRTSQVCSPVLEGRVSHTPCESPIPVVKLYRMGLSFFIWILSCF